MKFEMIRNANVEVEQRFNSKNFPVADIVVDGKHHHRFDAKSRVSKNLEIMTPDDMQQRLTGGHFFFANGQLLDFRDGQYQGFVHSDDSINKLIEVIGYEDGQSGRQQINNMDDLIADATCRNFPRPPNQEGRAH